MTTDPVLEGLPPLFEGQIRSTQDGSAIFLAGWPTLFPKSAGHEPAGWYAFDFYPDDSPDGPVPAQVAAAEALLVDHATMGQAVVAALGAAIPRIHELFAAAHYPTEAGWPEIDTVWQAVTPIHVFVHDVGAPEALIGVELACDWDPEHGLGVLLRGTEVLGVDTAEAAFVGWMARAAAKGEHTFFLWNPPAPDADRSGSAA